MTNRTRVEPLLVIVIGALAILLPLLACLQYRWLGQVSEREREQRQSSLRRTLAQFKGDFDREIARIYTQFQSESEPSQRTAEDYAKLYAHWLSSAPYPKLVQEIFQSEFQASGHERLRRLNVGERAWEDVDATTEFGARHPLLPLDASIPAVIIPVLDLAPLPFEPHLIVNPQLKQIIVKLDLNYIRKEFFPALIQSHFGDGESEFRIEVTDRQDPMRIIYGSDGNRPKTLEPDAAEDLFALRLGEFRGIAGAATAGRPVRTFDVRVFRGIAVQPAASATFEIDSGLWQVTATHVSGSLDAAVAQVRLRNLALGFSILILLGASIVIVLVSSVRAQRLARQQLEFVSTVTHELRTPLAVICSAGENLADGVVRDPDHLKNYGKTVHREGVRLSQMVEQMLTLAGIQSGLKKHDLVRTNLSTVVNDAVNAMDASLKDQGFSLERCDADDELIVLAEATSLSRALQNLIGNAMKYSGSSRWLGLFVSKKGTTITVDVRDRGIGIASSDRARIFEPFYRGGSALDAQIPGSGLGLSLVKEIVREHGGRIDVVSSPGFGTTFTITLPGAPA